PGTVLLAEANMWPEDSASYFGNGDECHMNYHFPVMPRLFMALRMEDRYPITDIFDQTPEIPPTCQWAIFLRNHDELTLEMVTDEERDYMYKVYAKDPKARINLGIRHRLAPLVENNRRKIELLNCLLFSLRGTPVIYYGDEIGMGDNFYLGDRDGVRTPMQWSPDRNAGFSNANPQQLYLPLILDPEYHYESVNVETQARNPSSLLWFMKRMINMRKRYRAFGRGDMKFINVDNPKVIAFTRTYEDQTILVVANLSRYSQPAELDLNEFKGFRLVEVFSKNEFPVVKENQPYFFTLDSYTYEWFLLENAQKGVQEENSLSEITLSQWSDLMEKEYRQILESSILSSYLLKNTWFAGKQRVIHHIKLVHHAEIPVHGKNVFVLLAEVHYRSGLPEVYHIPVAMVTGKTAKKLSEDNPNAVLCKITVAEKEGLLADALYTTPYQHAVIQHLAGNLLVESPVNIMQFKGEEQLKKYIAGNPVLKSRVISHFKHYTAIAYNNDYFLRVYRQVERTTNPDVELTLFLGQEQNFPGIPKYAGSIEWRSGKDMMTIGLIQELIEYHGTGITFMQERLNNFNERILARNRTDLPPIDIRGSISEPVPFEILSDDFKELLGGPLAEGARLLGAGLGELHLALASRSDIKEFAPEDFSLHYQRSLYSGMQSLVRNTFSNLSRSLGELHFAEKAEAEKLLSRKNDVLHELKNIYKKKIDVSKIRIHGYFTLEQVLFTGKNISIPYLGGDPEKSFSEKRIKRSALRDAAAMIRSFHYVAHEGLRNASLREDEILRLSPYYSLWTHYLSGFFMHAYLEKVKGTSLIPKEKTDLELLLKTYLIETAIFNLNHVMRKQPQLI
ncbi:MAG TPA: alpha-glucosidase C-terminal domain-containing protein, partial [Parasegetibacter sp.]